MEPNSGGEAVEGKFGATVVKMRMHIQFGLGADSSEWKSLCLVLLADAFWGVGTCLVGWTSGFGGLGFIVRGPGLRVYLLYARDPSI